MHITRDFKSGPVHVIKIFLVLYFCEAFCFDCDEKLWLPDLLFQVIQNMDCACILGNRMHSMHAHGLCMDTVTVAWYTNKIEEYLRKKNARS